MGIEPDGVCQVVGFPPELQVLPLAPWHREVLVEAAVDVEEAVAAQRVAAAGLAGEGAGDLPGIERGSRIGPQVGTARTAEFGRPVA